MICAVAIHGLVGLGTELLPPADPRQFTVRLVCPPGQRVEATARVAGVVEELRGLRPPPQVAGYRAHFDYLVHGRRLRGSLYPLEKTVGTNLAKAKDLAQAATFGMMGRKKEAHAAIEALLELGDPVTSDTQVLVCGHAILEKFLDPYKALTAHALYLHSSEPMPIPEIDGLLAETLLSGELLSGPGDLSPLPLMGIPGWWPAGPQDEAFYSDEGVFRPRR